MTKEEKCLKDWGYKTYAKRFEQLIKKGKKEYKYPADLKGDGFYTRLNRCILTDISPYLFTVLAAPKCSIREYSVNYLWDTFENQKEKLDPLNLDIDENTCRIFGHEGRHRAEISHDLGIKKVPVKVCFSRYRPFKIVGDDYPDNKANRLREEIIKHGYSKELVDKWMADNNASWNFPEGCDLDNVKTEAVGVEQYKTRDKADDLRNEYNVINLRNKWRRISHFRYGT